MPTDAARIRGDIDHEIARRGGAARIVYDHPEKKYLEKRLADIASDLGKTPADAAIHLQMTGYDRAGGARMRGYSLSEIDIEHIMRQDFTATCTDGDTVAYGDGVPHARFYGDAPQDSPLRRRSRSHHAAVCDPLHDVACRADNGPRDRGLLRPGAGPTSSSSTSRRLPITPPSRSRTSTDRHSLRSRQRVPVVDRGKFTNATPGKVLTPAADGLAAKPGRR